MFLQVVVSASRRVCSIHNFFLPRQEEKNSVCVYNTRALLWRRCCSGLGWRTDGLAQSLGGVGWPCRRRRRRLLWAPHTAEILLAPIFIPGPPAGINLGPGGEPQFWPLGFELCKCITHWHNVCWDGHCLYLRSRGKEEI